MRSLIIQPTRLFNDWLNWPKPLPCKSIHCKSIHCTQKQTLMNKSILNVYIRFFFSPQILSKYFNIIILASICDWGTLMFVHGEEYWKFPWEISFKWIFCQYVVSFDMHFAYTVLYPCCLRIFYMFFIHVMEELLFFFPSSPFWSSLMLVIHLSLHF